MILAPDLLDDWGRRVLRACIDVSAAAGSTVYLVGGPVRDLLRGVAVTDLDLSVEGDAAAVARHLAADLSARLTSNERFLTWRLTSDTGRHVDLAGTRTESYPSPGALPVVAATESIDKDLARRDFTVNAIAMRVHDETIVDPFHGRDDLARGRLRTLHDQSFRDDPTRIFRAIRLAHRCRLEIEPETSRQLDDAIHDGALRTVSRERIWKEIDLACAEPEAPRVLAAFADRGCLDDALGPVRSENLGRLPDKIEVAAAVDRRVMLLGALTRGCSESTFAAIPYDQTSVARIRAIATREVALADQLDRLDDPFERFDACDAASREERVLASLENPRVGAEIDRFERALDSARAIRGDALGVPSGPSVGRAIRETRRAIFAGTIEPAEAHAFASRLAMQYLND